MMLTVVKVVLAQPALKLVLTVSGMNIVLPVISVTLITLASLVLQPLVLALLFFWLPSCAFSKD